MKKIKIFVFHSSMVSKAFLKLKKNAPVKVRFLVGEGGSLFFNVFFAVFDVKTVRRLFAE